MATRRGPDGTVRVAVSGTKSGENWANIFWADLTGFASATQADLDAWTDAFANAYKAAFDPSQTNDVLYLNAKAVLFTGPTSALESSRPMTGAGTQGAAGIDDNSACVVLSWRSNVYWRGGKPRTYLPGLARVATADKHSLVNSNVTAFTSAANAFLAAVNALSSGAITATVMGFVSFRSGNAERTPPVFFPIVDAVVHSRLGTQRRRLGKWTP